MDSSCASKFTSNNICSIATESSPSTAELPLPEAMCPAVPTAKIRRSLNNCGCAAAAAMVDVEEAGSTVCSTNKINFMCNFSKSMISSVQISGNLANPASDPMLTLGKDMAQDGSGSFATNDMSQHSMAQRKGGLRMKIRS